MKERKLLKEKIEAQTSNVVLVKSIEDMGVMELMDEEKVNLMKHRIKSIFNELYPHLQEKIERKKLEEIRWEHFKGGVIVSSLEFQGSQSAAWASTNLLSGNRKITVSIDTTKCAGTWFQVGLGNNTIFNKPGFASPSDLPFCYHGYYGHVNNQGTFPKFVTKGEVLVQLTICNNNVCFAVNGSQQPGTWIIPNQYRVLVDVHNPVTIAKFII